MSTTPSAIQGLPPGAVVTPIASQSSVDNSQIQGLPPGAVVTPIASATGTSTSTNQTPDQVPAGDRAWSAVKSETAPIVDAAKSVVTPPQDHKEQIVHAIGGFPALQVYRAARGIVNGVENTIKAPPEKYQQAKEDFHNSLQDASNKDYRSLAADTASLASDMPSPIPDFMTARNREVAQGTKPGGDLVTPLVKSGVDVGMAAAGMLLKNPFRAKIAADAAPAEPGFIQNVLKGERVAQAPAQAAVRAATGASAETPILAGTTTAADEGLAKVGAAKTAAYKQIDDIVGFDRKAEIEKLKDTQYAIKQPGADVKQLQTEIDESTKQIADADAKLAKAGIDPKVADQLNTSWEANKQFKNDLVKSTDPDGNVKVKTLLNRGKNARFNPRYGDRLAQAFGQGDSVAGKAIADEYMQRLAAAQKAGETAVSHQQLAKWIATAIGAYAVGHTAVRGAEAMLGQ